MDKIINYLVSPKAKNLRQYYPNVYLLLSHIAERRWDSDEDSPIGLKKGDAIIGNPMAAGLMRHPCRLALKQGIEQGLWEIVYNPLDSKVNKRTLKPAPRSIVVNLKDDEIWMF